MIVLYISVGLIVAVIVQQATNGFSGRGVGSSALIGALMGGAVAAGTLRGSRRQR
jgi:hypothetical protein